MKKIFLSLIFLLNLIACKEDAVELCILGDEYYEKQNYVKAFEHYTKACDLNKGGGCNSLGYLYEKGHGTAQDYLKASQYYTKACDLNEGLGCGNLGFLYDVGKGNKQDYQKANNYYVKACKLGDGWGCVAQFKCPE